MKNSKLLVKGSKLVLSMFVCLSALLPTTRIDIKANPIRNLNIAFVSDDTNDLYLAALENYTGITHYETLSDAVNNVANNTGIAVLADAYPNVTTIDLSEQEYALLTSKNLKLYIEYPENDATLGISYDGSAVMDYNRAVVVDSENMGMPNLSLLYLHGAKFLTSTNVDDSWMVIGKVAGYDTAIYGLNDVTQYSLLDVKGNVMIASTKLSQFISGQYSPYSRIQQMWNAIFTWLGSSSEELSVMEWEPLVSAMYDVDEELPNTAILDAVSANAQWYLESGVVISEEDNAKYGDYSYGWGNNLMYVGDETVGGDGTYGISEGYAGGSKADIYGNMRIYLNRRSDCNGESAGALALAGVATGNDQYKEVAYNVANWLLTESFATTGVRSDPNNGNYGLMSWNDYPHATGDYYGDDNAKAILGLLCAVNALDTDEFDQRILEAIIANFRTTGIYGFRGTNLSQGSLNTMQQVATFYNSEKVHYFSHFEALMWACYLWAYDQIGWQPLYDRTVTALTMMMEAYGDGKDNCQWRWQNGIQQERAKMILPLAWLVRLNPDNETYANWLDKVVSDMMADSTNAHGGILEAVGRYGYGNCTTPYSNAGYGQAEAPLIQTNGDPVVDNLYTQAFAFMGLTEAAAAVTNPTLKAKMQGYVDGLADFYIRSQQKSDINAYNGMWLRGFDTEKWETYGSDADAGWGAWLAETGWMQCWILSSLSLKEMNTNMWDLCKDSKIEDKWTTVKEIMIDPLDSYKRDGEYTKADQWLTKYGATSSLDDFVDGKTGTLDDLTNFMGLEGKDITITVDLQEEKTMYGFDVNFLRWVEAGIAYAQQIQVSTSLDDETYTDFDTVVCSETTTSGVKAITTLSTKREEVKARYVKVTIKNPGPLPNGILTHVWFDELQIQYDEIGFIASKSTPFYNSVDISVLDDNVYRVDVFTNNTQNSLACLHNTNEATYIYAFEDTTDITSIGYSGLTATQYGMYLPKATFYVSDTIDGPWEILGSIDEYDYTANASDVDVEKSIVQVKTVEGNGKYVKVVLNNHSGITGKPTSEWMFFDEIFINRTYKVIGTTPVNGSISFSKDEVLPLGSSEVTLTPANGFKIDKLLVNGVNVSDEIVDGKYTITNIKADTKVEASFKVEGAASVVSGSTNFFNSISWDILTDLVYGVDTVTSNSGTTLGYLQHCDEAIFILDLEEVKEITSLGYNAVTSTQYGVYLPKAEFFVSDTLTGEWTPAVTISAPDYTTETSLVGVDKSVTRMLPTDVSGRYVKVILSRYPNTEWIFIDEILINKSFNATTNTPVGGSVDVSSRVIEYGKDCTITVTPDTDYVLDILTINGIDVTSSVVDGKYTVNNVTENVDVVATFKKKDGFTFISASGNFYNGLNPAILTDGVYGETALHNTGTFGTLQFCDGITYIYSYAEATNIVQVGYSAAHYTPYGIYLPNVKFSIANELDGEYTPVATISAPDYATDASAGSVDEGVVKLENVDVTGKFIKVEVSRYPGKEWIFIDEIFIKKAFSVSVNSPANGTIVADANKVPEGSNSVITITPDSGYEVDVLKVNGADVTDQIIDGKYTIVDIKKDTTVDVSFKEKKLVTMQNYSANFSNVFDVNKLVDGIYGVDTVTNNTQGTLGFLQHCDNATFILELDESKDITSLGYNAVTCSMYGVYLPKAEFYVSETLTGEWTPVTTINSPDYANNAYAGVDKSVSALNSTNAHGKYVKVVLSRYPGTEWIFIDELFVNKDLTGSIFAVNVSQTGNGSYNIVTDTNEGATYGSDATITFTPDEGYIITSVTVNGQPATLVENTITIEDIKEIQAVQVTFMKEWIASMDTLTMDDMPYRLYVPEDYDTNKEYPVVLFFHGAGESGNDNLKQMQWVIDPLFTNNEEMKDAIIIAPHCPAGQQWVDTPWANGAYNLSSVTESNEMKTVMKILADVQEDYSTDTNRVYAIGYSMGGFATWDILARYPEKIAAGIPICGSGAIDAAAILKDIPIWTFHGNADTIVPYTGTKNTVDAILTSGGTDINFTTLEGIDHVQIVFDMPENEEVIPWLFEQTLEDRYGGIVEAKATLKELLDTFEQLDEGDFTAPSWEKVENLLEEAQAVFADSTALTKEVTEMNDKFNDAMLKLVNIAELKATLENVDTLLENNDKEYTPESKLAFQQALDLARAVYFNVQSKQDAVDEATNALTNAMDNLEEVADYSEVDKLVEEADKLNKKDYKDFSKVKEAIEAIVYGKGVSEQAEVDAMAKKLEEAMKALEKVEKEQNKGPGTGDSTNIIFYAGLLFLSILAMISKRRKA